MLRIRVLVLGLAAAALSPSARGLAAIDFIRGDANGDGRVSLADSHAIVLFRFQERPLLPCVEAGDANDDGRVNIADPVYLANFLLLNGPSPETPFPEAGPSLDSDLPCDAAGEAAPIEDPAAALSILETRFSADDGSAVVVVGISNSRPIGGISGVVVIEDSILEIPDGLSRKRFFFKLESLPDGSHLLQSGAAAGGRRIKFGYLASLFGDAAIPAGHDVPVFEIRACVFPGTAPRAYAIRLEDVEFADDETGRAIRPAAHGGLIEVGAITGTPCAVAPGNDPCLDFEPSRDLEAVFRVEGGTTHPGGAIDVPFIINATGPAGGYAVSLDFDETLLRAASFEPVYERPDGSEYDFARFEIDNGNASPGSAGVDEGFAVGAAIFSFVEASQRAPANRDNVMARIRFEALAGATPASTELRFLDGGQGSGEPVKNALEVCGRTVLPESASAFVFLSGSIEILPEITVFIRGDANGDGGVDISDPQATLGYLFLGRGAPHCFDAADANDDGRLDISDGIHTLEFLFTGGEPPPPPFPGSGADPTADGMRCHSRAGT
jgi:hypothetical protein